MHSADYVTDVLLIRGLAQRRPKAHGIRRDYFDLYDLKQRYEESFHEYFDAKHTVGLIGAVWRIIKDFALDMDEIASALEVAQIDVIELFAEVLLGLQYLKPNGLKPRDDRLNFKDEVLAHRIKKSQEFI